MAACATHRLQDRMLSVGSMGVVVTAMAAIDETVRMSLVRFFDGSFPIAVAMPDLRIQHLGRMLTDLTGLPFASQSPMLVFALVGFGLFVLMFRS
jgi:hypothetical protein